MSSGGQVMKNGRPVVAGCTEDPSVPARSHITARPRVCLLDITRRKDSLLLDQYRAGLVAALFVLPNPRRDVFDGIDDVLRSVIADHPMRPLGGIAANWQCR